jgi:hypothetical protein
MNEQASQPRVPCSAPPGLPGDALHLVRAAAVVPHGGTGLRKVGRVLTDSETWGRMTSRGEWTKSLIKC